MAGNACPVFRHSVISEQKQKAFLQGAHLPVDLSLSDSDLSPADAPWEKLDSAFKPLLSIFRPHLQEAALNTVGVYILVSKDANDEVVGYERQRHCYVTMPPSRTGGSELDSPRFDTFSVNCKACSFSLPCVCACARMHYMQLNTQMPPTWRPEEDITCLSPQKK